MTRTSERVRLLTRPLRRGGPSQDCLDEFDRAVLADPRAERLPATDPVRSGAFWAASAAFKADTPRTLRVLSPLGSRAAAGGPVYLAALMGPQFAKCVPDFLRPARKAVYLFDMWPDVWDRVAAFGEAFAVEHVFVSSSQSADALRSRVRSQVHWVPEGIDPRAYRARAPSERDVDVLQMGRRHEAHHDRIVDALARAGRLYRYERVKGEIIYPTREGLIDGLSRSRVSICVPSSTTHPERSGAVETMTLRYLQSMVSRCIVVGHAPAEMVRVFGYNPVVEIDAADPAGQLLGILDAPERYDDLVERNYRAILDGHTWAHRWVQMADILLADPSGHSATP